MSWWAWTLLGVAIWACLVFLLAVLNHVFVLVVPNRRIHRGNER